MTMQSIHKEYLRMMRESSALARQMSVTIYDQFGRPVPLPWHGKIGDTVNVRMPARLCKLDCSGILGGRA